MKAAFLDDANPAAVSHAVREVLERRGALVNEHLHSRVRFRGYTPARHSWSREGYVGIYQRTGERDVEVRLLLRARWPWRILWLVALVNVVTALLIVATDQPGTIWILGAFFMALALVAAAILYMQTWRPVRREERELMEAFEAEFRADIEGAAVLDDEARRLAQLEAELEGEIERRRVARERRASGDARGRFALPSMPRFSLRPGAKKPPHAPEEDAPDALGDATDAQLADRRAELERRKAELEAKRREMAQREEA